MVDLCDRQVGMPSVSLLIATSGMATDEQMNLLVVQLRFVTFFLLFVKGGKISITVFLLIYCDVCDRRNDF